MAIIKKTSQAIPSGGNDVEKLEVSCGASGNIKWCSCIKKSLADLQKIKQSGRMFTAISLLGYVQGESKTYVHIKTYTQMFIASLFLVAKKWKPFQGPLTDEYMNKIQCKIIQPYEGMKYFLIHTTTLMNLENIMPNERSQTQNVTYFIISFK